MAIDEGSFDKSREFREKTSNENVRIREASIETPDTIGVVERYHVFGLRAYI